MGFMNRNSGGCPYSKILFLGLSGYGYPHTRVRCYHFQRELANYAKTPSEVLSWRDHLAPRFSEGDMYRLRDRDKLMLTWRGLKRLWGEKGSLFYLQKAHFHSAAPYLLHRLGRNDYIFDYDDYDVELSNFFSRGRWNQLFFGSNRWDRITEEMARRALCCIAASHELIDYLKPLNPHVYYIPTGVDAEAFTPKAYENPGEGPVVFLWNGLVWGEPIVRSIRLLLEAFARVHERRKNVELRLIGGGDSYPEVEALLRDRYSRIPVKCPGWLDPGRMPEQLRQADVGCLPLDAPTASRWLRSKSPTKMFEYMAAGLPVVSSAVGEPIHVIENGKSGFLVKNAEEMAERMEALARDRDLRRRIGLGARARIEDRFSLRILGKQLFDLLSERGWVESL